MEHLFETDIPVVSLFKKKAGKGEQHFIACSIPDENGEVDHYFAVFVGRKHLIRYFSEQCDLRYLFAFASGRKYYEAKTIKPDAKGKVVLTEFLQAPSESQLPDSRFFASFHTSEYGFEAGMEGEQRLLIDGNWNMQDFGAFYQKFSDIYSYEQAIEYLDDGGSSRAQRVEKAFLSKPFKGGSSYMGFFNDLFDVIPHRERPSLEGIEYHSPGYVDLSGRDQILNSVERNIKLFLKNDESIQVAHDNLRGFMSKSKLLRITGRSPDISPKVAEELTELSDVLYDLLPVGGKDKVALIIGKKPIVKAKIALALFRRLKYTALFFAQGRLTYAESMESSPN
ncbi:hypothetical protein [Phaeobacter sp. 22II1-1F12B]|uniref:hypothetical protein n=1 Tax=Phaeobacter sp. 22II1-1F12B TaxID=1317111 RepID=UPI001187107F|nr:hypothetical protein [Phaeobacter sp. 22II1-1F12B]